ncbi:O-antigen ligase family protein [Roseibacterium sp. SDUM158016]|uniref:O-antigen ligase family protein n=1 Tax=Roseicyclus sediminis TaxID=2980997 RepID=UPI0021D0BC4F|nr:O-antigen ligase family protein [Roseibacterium sp. SDUM158016]MCU4653742.1 O-antigen ligase family protein [Roseibacterium sp. SDUM158016]
MVEHAVRRSPIASISQGIIGWSTLVLTLLFVLLYGGNSPAYWTLFGVVVIALFVLQCGLTMLRGGHWTNARLFWPALLYLGVLAWGMLQTLPSLPDAWAHPFWALVPGAEATVSATPVSGGHGVLRLACYAMIFWIAIQASMNAKRAQRFLVAFALWSTALALFGLYAAISGNNFILGEQANSNVSASFVNRNSYATYAAMGLATNLGLYLHLVRSNVPPSGSRGSALRGFLERFFSVAWIFLFGAVICLSALLLTASRAGVASGLVAAIVLFVMLRRDSGSSKIVWLLAAILLGAFLTVLSENVLTRLLGQTSDLRFVIYPVILEHLRDRFWLGHGFGAFHDTFRPFVPLEAASGEWDFAHSTYLENLWEMGIPAALAFYAALAWVAAVIFRGAVKRRRNRVFPVVALACLVAGALHSLVDFSLQMPATAAMFAFILGVGWAHAWQRGSATDDMAKERGPAAARETSSSKPT